MINAAKFVLKRVSVFSLSPSFARGHIPVEVFCDKIFLLAQ